MEVPGTEERNNITIITTVTINNGKLCYKYPYLASNNPPISKMINSNIVHESAKITENIICTTIL